MDINAGNDLGLIAAHPFVSGVGAFILRQQLLPPPHPESPDGIAPTVLVALSGGADSVALLAALVALGYNCRAAHCNFHLRGEESNRDMRHAAAVCARLGVEMHLRHFTDIAGQCRRSGRSTEMVCRNVRYEWFDRLLDLDGACALAVGHHAEDRAETFMLNLLRGTGIAGLTSMQAHRGSIVRPLLGSTREEIERFLADCRLDYITDSSNTSDAHRRNRLRNHVFPMLESLFPGARDSIIRTIAALESTRAVYDDAVAAMAAPYTDSSGHSIRLAALADGQRHAFAILFEILRPHGFNASQVRDILDSRENSGLHFRAASTGTIAELDRGVLTISSEAAAARNRTDCHDVGLSADITVPGFRILVSRHPAAQFHTDGINPALAFFDAAAITDGKHRWQLRHPVRGDRMVPFGQHKPKLLSDLFANARYTAAQKRSQWLLTCDGEIVWAPGLRNSAAFPVGPATRHFIKLDASDNFR